MAVTQSLSPSFEIFMGVLEFLAATWFLWLPIFLFYTFRENWLAYVRACNLSTMKWILLEIKVPREVAKSPKAMESIFAGIHGTGKGGNLVDRYWKGVFSPWFSLEIVGNSTGVHFFIWTPTFYKKLIESQIFAQYPSCEITETEDYTKSLPAYMPNSEWGMWGTEFVLTKPDAYPIRTYEDFTLEKVALKEEDRKIDPLSSMMEFLGSLNESEYICIQMVVRPAGDGWKKEGEALIGKLAGRETKRDESFVTKAVYGVSKEVKMWNPVATEKKEGPSKLSTLTPGELDVIKAIERNISKIGLEVGLRWMYLAKRDLYNPLAIPAVMGIFKQFAAPTLNGFRPNKLVTPSIDYFFKNKREALRKRRLYDAYKLRSFFMHPYGNKSKRFVLSTEELATIYHFPGTVVGAPGFARIEAKKGTPPANLPM